MAPVILSVVFFFFFFPDFSKTFTFGRFKKAEDNGALYFSNDAEPQDNDTATQPNISLNQDDLRAPIALPE